MDVGPECMSTYHILAVPTEARLGAGPSSIAITDDCEPPCGCWKLKLALLQMLLST